MAASTSADSNNNYMKYDVFISHRGPDIKKTFSNHLYRLLIFYGLRVFLDYQELQEGEEFGCQIKGAIRTASVQIAIFSPTYADSQYCLDELVLMLESGAPIIPVFYAVQPGELISWTQGKRRYARSLQILESKRIYEFKSIPNTKTGETGQPRYDYSRIQNWRTALFRVSIMVGLDLDAFNGDDDKLADRVVQGVMSVVKPRGGWSAANYRVGLHEKVEEFGNKVLCAKPQVVGIVGVGGVGKTTLAKELFNQKRVNYSKYCFLPNVREEARLGFLNSLQKQLLKSLTGTDAQMNSIDEGKEALKKHLSSCRVLMVLDDVDHLNQIDALLPVRTHLLSDSLVVITSRDEGVITSSGVETASIYHLTGLNHQDSEQLFCAFAFNRPYPRVGFEHFVDKFLEVCEGLPLCLRVLGALVNDKKDPFRWKELLVRIQRVLPRETKKT